MFYTLRLANEDLRLLVWTFCFVSLFWHDFFILVGTETISNYRVSIKMHEKSICVNFQPKRGGDSKETLNLEN